MAIVTLVSDIGTKDFIVGAFKGQILSQHSHANIVDISHNLSSTNFMQSAYLCANAYKFYPENTINVILLNLFETNPDYILLAKCNKQYFICADNGFMTMLFPNGIDEIVKVPIVSNQPITTLIVTQKIASIVRQISEKYRLDEIGKVAESYLVKNALNYAIGNDWIEAQILFIDSFENIVVNIRKDDFEEIRQNRAFKIELSSHEVINRIDDNYSAVLSAEKVAWFNSAGYLELSVKGGNMAGLFGFSSIYNFNVNNQNNLFYKTIKIYFEKTNVEIEEKPQNIIIEKVKTTNFE